MASVLAKRYPLFGPALGIGLGIIAAANFAWIGQSQIYFGVASAVFFFTAWKNRRRPYAGLCLLAAFFLWGAARLGERAFAAPDPLLTRWMESRQTVPVWLEAEDYCRTDGRNSRFDARVLGYFDGPVLRPYGLKSLVKVGSPSCPASPGRRFLAWGRFSRPKRFRNPFSFDYPRYLRLQGIPAVFFVKQERFLLPWGKDPGIVSAAAARLRFRLLALIRGHLPTGASRGVLEALVVGEEGGVSDEVKTDFRRTGLTHVLAVSGLHLSLVFLMAYGPFYGLLSLKETWAAGGAAKKAALAAAWVPTLFYAAVVGPGPSVARALAFASVAVMIFLQDGKRDAFSVLLLSFVLYLSFDPGALFDLSFQFSYLAVAVLVFTGKKALAWSRSRGTVRKFWLGKAARWVFLLLATNVAVNLAVLPILADSFQEASAVAPLANLLAVPLFTAVIHPVSWMAVLIETLSTPAAHVLWVALDALVKAVLAGIREMSSWSFASFLIGPFPRAFWAGYAGLVYFIAMCGPVPRRYWLAAALLLTCGLAERAAAPGGREAFALTAFDVGQGESLLLENGASAYLVDGGGFAYSDFDIGRAVVIPELLGKRIGTLRALVLTHPDADHLKGLMSVAALWPVEEFWYPAAFAAHPHLQALLGLSAARGIRLRPLARGERFRQGEIAFEVLWPEDRGRPDASDNDQSLVLRACRGTTCFLLTGDLERDGEDAVGGGFAGEGLRMLKLAHHGSRTSSSHAFLAANRPHLALISAGEDNRFHFPHPEVLRRLRDLGIPVLRTDLSGQIRIRGDGRCLHYESFSGDKGALTTLGRLPSWWCAIR